MDRRISALTAQKRNPERINVYLDGEFAFGLSRIVAAWLYVGQDLSDEKIAELQSGDMHESAYQKALNYLSYRIRSEAEVRKHLVGKGIQEEVVVQVLVRLQNAGLVDDERFARSWVENRSEYRPRSRRALVYELKRKGVSEAAIHSAVDEIDEEELAYLAALKKAMRYNRLEWPAFRQKMHTYLAGRGFNYEVSSQVVARIWREINENIDTVPNAAKKEVDQ